MKLTALQWCWMAATAIFVTSLLLDVANVLNVPAGYMLLGSTLLLVSSWWLMPSTSEIARARRRRP